VGEVTDLLDPPVIPEAEPATAHEVVTLENLRAVSPGRSRGLGIAVVVFSLIEILYFGFHTTWADETTIQFGYNTATNVPVLANWGRALVAVLGAACVALGVAMLVRRRMRALGVAILIAGGTLLLWVLALLLHVNNLTLREVGEVLGVSESRVCQIHNKLKSGLRELLSADEQLFLDVA